MGLLQSVPNPKSDVKEKLTPIEGQPPDLLRAPTGCPFAARCKYAMKFVLIIFRLYLKFQKDIRLHAG